MATKYLHTLFAVFSFLSCCTFGLASPDPAAAADPAPTESAPAKQEKHFVFDPKLRQWFAYDEFGQLVKSGRASGGADYCKDIQKPCHTIVGEFKVESKQGPRCVSHTFPIGKGGAKMPYCFFFHGGFAVHGSDHVRDFNASHGCVRIDPKEAEWLYKEFMDIGTTVIVKPYKS